MSSEESILKKLRALSPEKQREVIDFIERLERKNEAAGAPRRSVEGLWADFGTHVTEEDIAEIRAEIWRNFPREDV